MRIVIKPISSLEKVRSGVNQNYESITDITAIAGERIAYQAIIKAEDVVPTGELSTKVWATTDIEGAEIKIYRVNDVIVDKPAVGDVGDFHGDGYIIEEPGFLPDILTPIEEQNNIINLSIENATLWIKLDVPKDATPGKYTITLNCGISGFGAHGDFKATASSLMEINILDAVMPEQKMIYTRWFYADCIADAHNVEIFSEKHWGLMEKYIAAATDVGINMILVPVHTPPLDTEVGTRRPCVQLVDIEKKGDVYEFKFDKFTRFIAMCKNNGVKYYEIAHLFSQWGAEFAPNIVVTENGVTDYMFGWHVKATSDEYRGFLKQYIAAISAELVKEGISEFTYFHISDEPNPDNLDKYKAARDIIKPLIGKSKTFDALSAVEFYLDGLVECPVTSIETLHNFLPHNIENQWMYYCCHPELTYTNSFIALPSPRTRALGYQLYKYNIKGFLHWGYNFYNARVSQYNINPYVTTSADGAYASGDGFIVYPARNGVYPSIRGEVIYQAMQDVDVCYALEALIGREAVIKMIDAAAGGELNLEKYPQDAAFYENLRTEMVKAIANK